MSLIIVLAGLFLLVLSPLISRWVDRAHTMALSMMGLLFVVLALVLDVISGNTGSASFIISVSALVWAFVVFVASEIVFALMAPKSRTPTQQNCIPVKTRGRLTRVPSTGDAWVGARYAGDAMRYVFQCSPTNSSLEEYFFVSAKTYYVLIAFFYRVTDTRTITIECEVDGGRCKLSQPLNIVGPAGGTDRPLKVVVAEDILFGPNSVTISVDMAAALSAPTVQVTGGVRGGGAHGSMTINFPGAGLDTSSVDMGTYAWRCAGAVTSTGGGGTHGGTGTSTGTMGGSGTSEGAPEESQPCKVKAELVQVKGSGFPPNAQFHLLQVRLDATYQNQGEDDTVTPSFRVPVDHDGELGGLPTGNFRELTVPNACNKRLVLALTVDGDVSGQPFHHSDVRQHQCGADEVVVFDFDLDNIRPGCELEVHVSVDSDCG